MDINEKICASAQMCQYKSVTWHIIMME